MKITTACKGLVMLLGMTGAAQAQDRPVVLVDIGACMEIAASSLRHDCFDALASEARMALEKNAAAAVSSGTGRETAPVATLPAPPAPDTDTAAAVAEHATVETFGTSAPAGPARIEAGTEGREEMRDRIRDIEEREPGRWLITLESGQVWYQNSSGGIRLRKNMDVRIYPSPLGGSYRLAGIDGRTGFIQVSRVR